MKELAELIKSNQAFLVKRTLKYAKLHNYTKYTSTLEEAWSISINGLSEALLSALKSYDCIPELIVDEDYATDRIGSFGVLEAQRHRNRGVTLEMFLGLMKYYRQSYLDLVITAYREKDCEYDYELLFVNRFFDRVELAFCSEWSRETKEKLVLNLQDANRTMTNEKNKYLTIFESIPTPAIILNNDNMIDNMNKAANEFLKNVGIMGTSYYADNRNLKNVDQILPWLVEEFNSFIKGIDIEVTLEKNLDLPGKETRNIVIKFHRMLDVSEKYKGTVILFTDLTYRKQIEDRLKFISFHDDLTGLYNRAFFKEELFRMDSGRFDPVGIIECDVDGLKVVNDTFGHQAGDILITSTAAILSRSFRENDVVARVGGDEFAIVLPSCSSELLKEACERTQTALAKHNEENPLVPLSFTIGAALGDTHNGGIDLIYRNADNQMYQNKPKNKEKYQLLFNSLFALYGNKLFK
jgi:diguanylate cyclase (GGDEF)-like protein